MKPTLIALLLILMALPLAAQSSPRDFGSGPAKWLMTSDEQKAWRQVKTDDEAVDFIDLFWARRDPTPGTGRNENRTDFDSRVAYSDRYFKEARTRGAMSERGRVLILLGFPKGMSNETSKSSRVQYATSDAINPNDPTGGRQLAARDDWEYSYQEAQRFRMPKIEVVFIHDRVGEGVRRDPQRTDFTMALPNAIKYYITSPELTSVPDWASSRMRYGQPADVPTQHVETTTTLETRKGTQILIDEPQVVAKPAGAGNLVFLKDSMKLQPESGVDPFASVAGLVQFPKGGELGWAAEYCSGRISPGAPAVKVQFRITAESGDTFSTDPEEFVPDSIKASPGCYLLRGVLPLTDVEPGAYKLSLTVTGAAAGESYNLGGDFRVQ